MAEWSEVSADDWTDYVGSDTAQVIRAVLDPIMLREVDPQGKAILDVGCGEGYFSRVLRANGAQRVVGCDISSDLIKKAQERDPDGEYRVYDLTSGPPPDAGSFDAVTASMVLMDLPDLDASYRSISAGLRPSGRFVAAMVNPYYCFPVGDYGWALTDGLYQEFDPRKRPWKLFGRQLQGLLLGRFESILYIRDYFESRVVEKKLGNTDSLHFHRPFSEYVNLATQNGLVLRSFLEPRISPELAARCRSERLAANRSAIEPIEQALSRIPLFFVLVFERTPSDDPVLR
jgi:SAM-dependent methyltransferase